MSSYYGEMHPPLPALTTCPLSVLYVETSTEKSLVAQKEIRHMFLFIEFHWCA